MRATTVAVSRRRLTVATAVQIGGRVVGAFLGVLVAATLARSLTRPEFGELSLALTILALAGSLSDLGIGQIAVREMARRPQDRARIAGALCVAQLTMGVVLGVIGIVIAFALMHGAQARVMAVFVMATMPLGALGALTIAAQARLRPELVIIPALVQNVLWLAVVVALGAGNGALSLYGLGALVAAVVQSAVIVVLTVRITSVTFTGTRTLIVDLLRMAWPIGLAGMFVTAYYRIDALLLFHYRGATPNAYYSAAYRVLDVLQILPMTVSGVLLPLLASAEREGAGYDRIRQLFQFAIALLLAVAVPVAICGAILAPGVVRLIYGPHYHSSVYLLQVLLPAFIPICLGYVLTGQLILHGLLRPYVVITMVGAVLNIVANAFAIPRYGAPAAAWTTLATELLVMAGIAAVVDRRLRLRLPAGRAVRCLGAAAVTGAAVWAVRSEPLIVGLVVAAIVYPPCLLVSRAVTVAELRALLTRQAAANA
ncbi:MAG TPA: flippase [Solirubrobacteraceae bacterium]|jgi:O-antigen/teichoic acid export membrane protein